MNSSNLRNLNTPTLEKLNRCNWERQGEKQNLQLLLDRILLRRYLLSSRFEDFGNLAKRDHIRLPSNLMNLLATCNNEQLPYQSQIKLITSLVDLSFDDELFENLKRDIRVRFIDHVPYVNVVATSSYPPENQSLMCPALTFIISSNANRKIPIRSEIFASHQRIEESFRQTTEQIQRAMSLSSPNGEQYWYALDLFQKLAENGAVCVDGKSAGAAIGWLIFLIEKGIFFSSEVLSIWGVYDSDTDRFCPVDGLRRR